MDVAYNQHSPYSRRHGRSQTNLNHLTLAPLTSRLPLLDTDTLPEPGYHASYIEGRSAPTTPSVLSRSSSRVSLRKSMNLSLPKSKSSTHLLASGQPRSTPTTPNDIRPRRTKEEMHKISAKDRNNSDWLLRAGAAMSTSARESKGQAWLVSRASSTSLTGQRDEDEEELERELARERERNSRRGSRRGSAAGTIDADDEFSTNTTRRSWSFGPATGSRSVSRFGSRTNSRRGSRARLATPGGEREGYFDHHDFGEEAIAEPDFLDVEDDDYVNEDEAREDEAAVKRLARAGALGFGGWVEKMLGWTLFAVDEDGEETETGDADEKADESEMSSRASQRNLDSIATVPGVPPAPKDGEAQGWQDDAYWLLEVASKVLL